MSIVVWFRDGLRLADHPALAAAAATKQPVVCLYILDDKAGARPIGSAARWWLAQSLRSLETSLDKLGQTLVLRRGASAKVLADVAREVEASAVHTNRIRTRESEKLERDAEAALDGIALKLFDADLLAEPEKFRNKEGRGPRVFTPFWKRVLAESDIARPLPAPKSLPRSQAIRSDKLDEWTLEPTKPDWAVGMREAWTPGEAWAHKRLKEFLGGAIKGYATERDRPDKPATSRLSPHLRFGEISPRQVFHAARFAAEEHPALGRDIEKFLSELGWREFCHHLLFDVPDLHRRNLQASFDAFPWRTDKKALRAWQRGETGYPIVDAGMRELWQTGTMHNRVRMVVASFLVKHLLIDWREGEDWFWDTLVDADEASNPANWQWVAGCGADAAPYFRIFNPVLQGEKFDPEGLYVRRYVPELAKLPAPLIHKPWEATPLELASAGVTLGETYPEPIVEHKMARERALAALKKTKG